MKLTILKIAGLVVLCLAVGIGAGYLYKSKINKKQIEAAIELEVSERQDAKREELIKELQEQIEKNQNLAIEVEENKEAKENLAETKEDLEVVKKEVENTETRLTIARENLKKAVIEKVSQETMIEVISDENSALDAQNLALRNERKVLYDSLDEADKIIEKDTQIIAKLETSLKENTEKLEKAEAAISYSQEEIERFRELLKDSMEGLGKNKLWRAGAAVTCPLGGEVMLSFDIPKLPLGIWANGGALFRNDSLVPFVGVGVMIRL